MSFLECIKITKQYEDITALNRLNISLDEGEILALVGPSGCGKTTFLRLVAGFEKPSGGSILLAGRLVSDAKMVIPPEQRGVGMVFQEYALFPHLTVRENIAFGLQNSSQGDKRKRVGGLVEMNSLVGLEDRYPHELSGGERQRVALARALAPDPLILLMDEPFSNLDQERRLKIRSNVRSLLKQVGATVIFVTHDQEEAVFFGDRLAVLNEGILHQVGTPEAVFHDPQTHFIAEFLGQSDFLPGVVGSGTIETEIGRLRQSIDLPEGCRIEVALRADDVEFRTGTYSNGYVEERQFKGAVNLYRLRLESGRVVHSLQPHTRIITAGTKVWVSAEPGHALACFLNGRAVQTVNDTISFPIHA